MSNTPEIQKFVSRMKIEKKYLQYFIVVKKKCLGILLQFIII